MAGRARHKIPKGQLKKLAKALGGRAAIAEAIGMSRPAVDRYFIGKGMRAETYDKLMRLIGEHVNGIPSTAAAPRTSDEPELVPEPPTLEEEGGHLFALLARALAQNSGVDALSHQLDAIENRLARIEENQRRHLHAWQMDPVAAGERMPI